MLKNCVVVFSIFGFIHYSEGLQCWNCQNANDVRECMREGFLEICSSGKDVCERIARRENGIQKLFKQCKQRAACQRRMLRNIFPFGERTRCNEEYASSLCSCCCNADQCNADEKTCQENKIASVDTRSKCPRLKYLYHGNVRCSRGRNVGSRCRYRCTENNYSVYPPKDKFLTCLPSGQWDRPEPCCALPCPPHLIYDFIILKYGTNSTSPSQRFVTSNIIRFLIRKLFPSPEIGFLMSRIQFSSEVHHSNKFLFHEKRGRDLIENTPDDRVNGGRALRWAYENLRGVGSRNRQDVRDLIIIITDKSFDDDVSIPAKAWRDAGALVYGHRYPDDNGNYPSYEQMLQITGDPRRIFTLENRSIEAIERMLDAEFKDMCRYRCQNHAA